MVLKLTKVLSAFWPHLTNDKTRPSFVGIDHDQWKLDSSEEDIENICKL